MPLLKVHVCSMEIPARKPLLTKRLREVMVEKLHIDEQIGQVVLYESLPQHRAIHPTRDNQFVFMEVLLYPGRTQEMKEALMKGLVDEVNKILQVDIQDINCCLLEVHQENWFGGISHKFIEK